MLSTSTKARIRLRHARPLDGPALHRLVLAIGTLEPNSGYAYALLADHFRDTTIVAEDHDARPVGLVIGYRPPLRPEAYFVWQVGVHPSLRRTGLGATLLDATRRTRAGRSARWIEATVAHSNVASRRLFEGLARRHHTALVEQPGYGAAELPDGHEPEPLLRIGPFLRPEPREELP